jgi:hypothetical protein
MPSGGDHPNPEHDSLPGCFLRLFWLMIGNALLALALLQILFSQAPFFSGVDLFFWSVVGGMIAARFADVAYFRPATAAAQPTALSSGWQYVLTLIVAAATAWILAHLAAPWLPLPHH